MPKLKATDREGELIERAHRYLPGGSNGNLYLDMIIKEGRGSHIWDVSGNEYIDYLLGSGPMLIGHAHPDVVAAVQDQLKQGSSFFGITESAIQLAEEIVKAVPCAQKVRFCSTGSEATLYAMRVARAYRRCDKVLKFEGGFHGMNDYSLMSMAPAAPLDFPMAAPDSAGIPRSIQEDVLIAPFNDIEVTLAIIERHHEELAGVIIEPQQRVLPPKPGFLQALREVTQQYEVPLIFDEIVTGFRHAYGGAQEYYGVTPDLCALGKAVAGGYPLTAVAGREELMSYFDPNIVSHDDYLPQIGTLSGNPVAAVAGLATLEVLKREGTYERLFDTGKRVMSNLQRLLDEAEMPAKVVGEPVLFDVYFTDGEITDYRSTLEADLRTLGRFNLLLRERGVLKGDLKYYISTVHTQEDIDATIEAFGSAIDELKG